MGLAGLLGLAAGSVLLIYVPTLNGVSQSLLLFGGFHILGLIVLGLSAYLGWIRRPEAAQAGQRLAWLNGATVATLIAVAAAVALQVTKPDLWPLSFLVIAQGVAFFAGSLVIRDMHSLDIAALPLVDLRIEAGDRVLDLGCGSGRSTLALARALPARIDALDQFTGRDAWMRDAVVSRLRRFGLDDRVDILSATLHPLAAADATYAAVASIHVLDHRGGPRDAALREMRRVLRPGGRILVVVRVRSWALFSALHLLSLRLGSRRDWRLAAQSAGLEIVDEGRFNASAFLLLEKPF